MTEEQITKTIILWLEKNGWEIVCFDFPQSGTGIPLHTNISLRKSRNYMDIIPDIVAAKKNTVAFFENKDKFVLADLLKINHLKTQNTYSESIGKLLKGISYNSIIFGIGLPFSEKNIREAKQNIKLVDFFVFVHVNQTLSELYSISSVLSV